MTRARQFILNTMLMSATSLLLQGIGMGFNIYISDKIGAEGVGLFTVIMSVNSFMVTFSTGGMHIATVRLICDNVSDCRKKQIKRILWRCGVYGMAFGVLTMLVGLWSADFVGKTLLADSRSIRCIRLLALIQPFNSLSCVVSGYLSAQHRAGKSALVQLLDQVLTVGLVSLGLASGMPFDTEYACLAIIGGNSFAHIVSTIFATAITALDISKLPESHPPHAALAGNSISKQLLSVALPVAVTAWGKSGLSTVKNLLIPLCLRTSGEGTQLALEQYGMLVGMAFPVVMLPQLVIGTSAGLMMPEIAKSRAKGNPNNVKYIISRAFQFTGVYSIGIGGIIFAFAEDIGSMIYSNDGVALYIKMLAPLVPVLYLDSVVDAALGGIDKQVSAMKISMLDSAISIILIVVLLPQMGIVGYVVTLYVCKLLNCTLSILQLKKTCGLKFDLSGKVLMPCLSCGIAVTATELLVKIFGACSPLQIITAMYFYGVLIRITGAMAKDDLRWLFRVIFPQNTKFQANSTEK